MSKRGILSIDPEGLSEEKRLWLEAQREEQAALARQARPKDQDRLAKRQGRLERANGEAWPRHQHDSISEAPSPDETGKTVGRVTGSGLLRKYLRDKAISGEEYDAGEKLRALWEAGEGLGVRITRYGAVQVGQKARHDVSDQAIAALSWVRAALSSMAPELALMLVRVVINGDSAAAVARDLDLDRRARGQGGIVVLRLALRGLRRFDENHA
ncbi:MAG: DUF6456 domain-containing protein [Kiloniellales bacterium]|nr:DUF6456 domain-containing protein [Kiloniellales bacterium]